MGIDGISAGVQPDYSARTSSSHSSTASQQNNAETAATGGREKDSVTISQQARDLLAQSREVEIPENQFLSPEELIAQKKENLYKKEDLNEVREKFRELMKNKEKIYSDIDKIVKDQGVKLAKNDTLRIEVGSKGEVLVGGIADAKTAKAIEKALNEDKDLVKRIRTNRNAEINISGELEEITGMSLSAYKSRLKDVQSGNALAFNLETGGQYTRDELEQFADQSLYLVDPEFMGDIASYLAVDKRADIVATGNLLADPGEAMDNIFRGIISKIDETFKAENKRTKREDLKDFVVRTEEDQEWVDSLMLSLKDVDIQIDSAGNITIEGNFADDPTKNARWTEFVEETIKSTLQDNPATGEKSGYTIASERLVNLYEDQFDQFGSDAVGATTIRDGNALSIESHIANPEREEEVKEEVQSDVNAALQKMGLPAGIEVEVEVNPEGRIIVTGISGDEEGEGQVLRMMDVLNTRLESANPGDKGDGNTLPEILGRLRANIDELKVYMPGGAKEVQKVYSEE